MKIVDTKSTVYPWAADMKIPDAGLGCLRQSYWLARGDGSSPVLLVEDCDMQIEAKPPGASATEIVGCDLILTYFEEGESACRIREVGIHLDRLRTYREIESDGVPARRGGYRSNPATRRAIRLPRGKGVAGSPLIEIDGPATLDRETPLPDRVPAASGVLTASTDEPSCVGAGTCRITRTRRVPKCTGLRIVDTLSTLGPTAPDGVDRCTWRSYWLVRSAGMSPVLLAEDCVTQIGAGPTGTATTRIEKCDILFKYIEYAEDDRCFVRDVGIHLNALQPFREIERDGVSRKNQCKIRSARRRIIRLPRGTGGADSALIEIDGRDLRDNGGRQP